MRQIALEDIATVFVSEFVKTCRHKLIPENASCCGGDTWGFTPFLKMSYARRRKLVEKVIDRLGLEMEPKKIKRYIGPDSFKVHTKLC